MAVTAGHKTRKRSSGRRKCATRASKRIGGKKPTKTQTRAAASLGVIALAAGATGAAYKMRQKNLFLHQHLLCLCYGIDDTTRKSTWPRLLGITNIEIEASTITIDDYKGNFENSNETIYKPTESPQFKLLKSEDQNQIWRDVNRCNVFKPRDSNIPKLCELFNILCKLFDEDTSIKYSQGFHSVVAIFLSVMGNQAHAYVMAKHVITSHQCFFVSQPVLTTVLDRRSNKNYHYIGGIMSQLKSQDSTVNIPNDFEMLLTRSIAMLNTWFAGTFGTETDSRDYSKVVRLYDTFLCSEWIFPAIFFAAVLLKNDINNANLATCFEAEINNNIEQTLHAASVIQGKIKINELKKYVARRRGGDS